VTIVIQTDSIGQLEGDRKDAVSSEQKKTKENNSSRFYRHARNRKKLPSCERCLDLEPRWQDWGRGFEVSLFQRDQGGFFQPDFAIPEPAGMEPGAGAFVQR
jgi:hypothetical protein